MSSRLPSEYERARAGCVYFRADEWRLLAVRGRDALDFLQNQTTNDVKKLRAGEGQNSAAVDRKGCLLAVFSLHRDAEDSVLVLIEESLRQAFLDRLSAFIFRDDVMLVPHLPQDALLAVLGPKSALVLRALAGAAIVPDDSGRMARFDVEGEEILIIPKKLAGEDGFVVAFPAAAEEAVTRRLLAAGEAYGLAPVGAETREVLRLEAGIPRYGRDMSAENVLPETGLEQTAVSYDKGCYVGQEVVARMRAYGSPAIALAGIIIDGAAPPPLDADIARDGKKIGTVKSSGFSPSAGKIAALAYLRKEVRDPGREMDVVIGGLSVRIKTALLPFYQAPSRQDRAAKLYEEALALYRDADDLDPPIRLLREAVELNPGLAGAYEALGVMLAKQNNLDEAIALMKRLAEIDPGEIMAHANLSVYYMRQGRIAEAEQEKARATALHFEKILAETRSRKTARAAEEQKRREQLTKIDMFKQVLEIDSADQVANFGLSSIYYDMGRYEEALPHLRALAETHKNYSAAYLLLGKTLENIPGQAGEAAEAYRQGIAAASRKGDLMPLREMQRRLDQLLHSPS